ncbi:hypothetical protein P389DRAFT_194011 [Cystobasidium minutum MCA 4210]|uniref:uncharacterized protein n=1 Tax=Cystobasidium minutum MCA 4210 TaxID=1397322 RepID=UPI0034CF91B5|eukprot:jgi/Rhomi1/194011/gm1.2225_g
MARWGRAAFWGSVIAGGGYAIMKLVTPSDKQFYDSLSPELKRQVDDIRGKEKRREQYERMKAQAEAGEPIMQDTATRR